jgi:hypothetical protein
MLTMLMNRELILSDCRHGQQKESSQHLDIITCKSAVSKCLTTTRLSGKPESAISHWAWKKPASQAVIKLTSTVQRPSLNGQDSKGRGLPCKCYEDSST